MNIKAGNTIWLNVSKKLLKNKKWLTTPYEKLSAEARKELEHHSHTHPNATVTSSTTSHTHDEDNTAFAKCSFTGSANHYHFVDFDTTDSHNHTSTVVSFGSANLGSPNWWEHVHAVTLSSMGNGGTAHAHTQTPLASSCTLCASTGSHNHTAANTANGGIAHTHTIPANNTSNATQAGGTALSHVHPFSFTFNVYSHSHTRGAFNEVNCSKGKSHTATYTGSTAGDNHNHTASGNSGSGGESTVVTTGNFFQMF